MIEQITVTKKTVDFVAPERSNSLENNENNPFASILKMICSSPEIEEQSKENELKTKTAIKQELSPLLMGLLGLPVGKPFQQDKELSSLGLVENNLDLDIVELDAWPKNNIESIKNNLAEELSLNLEISLTNQEQLTESENVQDNETLDLKNKSLQNKHPNPEINSSAQVGSEPISKITKQQKLIKELRIVSWPTERSFVPRTDEFKEGVSANTTFEEEDSMIFENGEFLLTGENPRKIKATIETLDDSSALDLTDNQRADKMQSINPIKLEAEIFKADELLKNEKPLENNYLVKVEELPKFVFRQIKNSFKTNWADQTSEVTLRLKPESLGKIVLQLSTEGEKLTVKILTENNLAKNLLEENMFQLKQALDEQGIKSKTINVEVSSENPGQLFNQQNGEYSRRKEVFPNNKSRKGIISKIDEQNLSQIAVSKIRGFNKIEVLA